MFPELDLYCTDPAQHLTTAGCDLDDLGPDPNDLGPHLSVRLVEGCCRPGFFFSLTCTPSSNTARGPQARLTLVTGGPPKRSRRQLYWKGQVHPPLVQLASTRYISIASSALLEGEGPPISRPTSLYQVHQYEVIRLSPDRVDEVLLQLEFLSDYTSRLSGYHLAE